MAGLWTQFLRPRADAAPANDTAAPPMPDFMGSSSPVVKAAIEELKVRGVAGGAPDHSCAARPAA